MTDISKRSTVSKRIPEIDSLYVYKTSRKGVKLTRHLNKGSGYRYTTRNVIMKGSEDEIYDYHRTALIGGVEHGLVIVTKDGRYREVQKWIKQQIAHISESDVLLSRFKSATSSPQELGLLYMH